MIVELKPKIGLYEHIQNQLKKTASKIALNKGGDKMLYTSNNEITVNSPAKLSNGEIEILTGSGLWEIKSLKERLPTYKQL